MQFRFIQFVFFFLPFLVFGQGKDSLGGFGRASFYHDRFHGQETSNGEVYDKSDFTAAHKTYPFNSILLVTNKKNNKSVVVRVNDRGPFVKSRILDLSGAAAKKISMIPFGVVPVKIKVLNFLNPLIMDDNLLNDGEVWDCYGVKKSIQNKSVFIWSTDNWKHAFYMASCLSLEYKLDSLFVKVIGPPDKRRYDLLTPVSTTEASSKLILKLKSDGFYSARLKDNSSLTEKQHDDRSSK